MEAIYSILFSMFCLTAHFTVASSSIEDGNRWTDEWGLYSPYFSVPSDLTNDVPDGCKITFAQVLSRHGSRFPTEKKTRRQINMVNRIHSATSSYTPEYDFIRTYSYTLREKSLTDSGRQEMRDSGASFFERYRSLTGQFTPFIRASSMPRVVESAQKFSEGFHNARVVASGSDSAPFPYPILIIGEGRGRNNTLSHGACPVFEDGLSNNNVFERTYWDSFLPPIKDRVNRNLADADLTNSNIISLMELCPMETVASSPAEISQFCSLFRDNEWTEFGYSHSVKKWYRYGPGARLGPTQGVGFAQELLARMTNDRDYVTNAASYTSINHSLDKKQSTFPLGRTLYADFTHDSDLISTLFALGLYNETPDLGTSVQDTQAHTSDGYSAAWLAMFAARTYFEKMTCEGEPEELVRVIVNDRVIPLKLCDSDALGRCPLSKFVDSLTFVTTGGRWNECKLR